MLCVKFLLVHCELPCARVKDCIHVHRGRGEEIHWFLETLCLFSYRVNFYLSSYIIIHTILYNYIFCNCITSKYDSELIHSLNSKGMPTHGIYEALIIWCWVHKDLWFLCGWAWKTKIFWIVVRASGFCKGQLFHVQGPDTLLQTVHFTLLINNEENPLVLYLIHN